MSSQFVILQQSPEFAWLVLFLLSAFAVLGWILYFRARTASQSQGLMNQAESAALIERVKSRDEQVAQLHAQLDRLAEEVEERELLLRNAAGMNAELQTRLESERATAQEKLLFVEQAKTALHDAFRALSHDALSQNNQQFLELAKTSLEKFHETSKGDLDLRTQAIDELLKPLKESLTQVDGKIGELEKTRTETAATMSEQIKQLKLSEEKLQSETQNLQREAQNLVQALRVPNVRGRWGEVQLRRVVELAGMVEHCDFTEQDSVNTEGGRLRPDLTVKLPNDKVIIVDSKVPLHAYLESIDASDDDVRKQKLVDHARQVRTHVTQLSGKSYWKEFDTNAEFAVMFLPGENLLSMALERDPQLIEYSASLGVMLATPMTLIALLRAVAYGWRQEQIAKNAQEISNQGKMLYERLAKFATHLSKLGVTLERSVESYNNAVGSLERNVLVSARRMRELGTTTAEDIETASIDKSIRAIQAFPLAIEHDEAEEKRDDLL